MTEIDFQKDWTESINIQEKQRAAITVPRTPNHHVLLENTCSSNRRKKAGAEASMTAEMLLNRCLRVSISSSATTAKKSRVKGMRNTLLLRTTHKSQSAS